MRRPTLWAARRPRIHQRDAQVCIGQGHGQTRPRQATANNNQIKVDSNGLGAVNGGRLMAVRVMMAHTH